MKKFSSKALLGALTTIGTIAGATMILAPSHQANAMNITDSAANVNIPTELGISPNNPGLYSTSNLTITPTYSLASSSTLIISLNNSATFVHTPSTNFYLDGANSGVAEYATCNLSQTDPSQLDCTVASGSSLSANISYTLSTSTNTINSVTISISSTPVVVSASDIYESGSATLFNPYQNYLVTYNPGTAYINPASLSSFNLGAYSSSGNSAYNSIVITSNAKTNSLTVASGNIFVEFSNIPSSVTSVSGLVVNGSSSSSSIVNNSTTLSFSYDTLPLLGNNSSTISFSFFNSSSSNIVPGTINVSMIGVPGSASGNIYGNPVNVSTNSSYSFTYVNNQPFLSFVFNSINMYGNVLFIPSSATTFSEYLQITLPQSTSVSNVSVYLGNSPCNGLLTSPAVTSTTVNGYTTYTIPLVGQLDNTCGISAPIGQLIPLQITLNPGTVSNFTSVRADVYVVTSGRIRRLPLTISASTPTQISY